MHMDPLVPRLVAALLVVLTLALALRRLKQPLAVVYLLAGVVMGPDALGLLDDREALARVGEFGVLLLLFSLGMELPLRRLLTQWKVPVVGTGLQILGSLACTGLIGLAAGWPLPRVVLLGFVISLSSTAVVLTLLRERGELESEIGQDVVGVLLVQDLALVPMLVVLGLLAGGGFDPALLAAQLAGTAVLVGLVAWTARRGPPPLPFADRVAGDHELQVFVALLVCLGLALLTGLLGLSAASGAFVAGILVGASPHTDWFHHSLEPFRVVLVALFLMSVGAVIDLGFFAAHWVEVVALAAAVFLSNTGLNAGILRALGRSPGRSLYGGALLSQIGEFSFVLAAVGLQSGLITAFGYQLTVSVIGVSLLLSPAWIAWASRQAARVDQAA